jgi:hypothetical protein
MTQRTSAPAFTNALTRRGVFTAAMLPDAATRRRRPSRGLGASIFIEWFLINEMHVRTGEIRPVNR